MDAHGFQGDNTQERNPIERLKRFLQGQGTKPLGGQSTTGQGKDWNKTRACKWEDSSRHPLGIVEQCDLGRTSCVALEVSGHHS